MLKKTITYTDYNGQSRTEDFYFNLSKAELVEMELSSKGGFAESLQKIIKSEDGKKIIATFQKIILQSYGEKSEDGRRFIKSVGLSEEFSQTEAYSELFMELSTNAEAGAAFVTGLIPGDLAREVEKTLEEQKVKEEVRKKLFGTVPGEVVSNPTDADLENMSREDLLRLAAQAQIKSSNP